MTLVWREEALARSHDRKAFDCGDPALNDYLVRYARQNHESGSAKTFVAVSPEYPKRILGYYSVCPASLTSSSPLLTSSTNTSFPLYLLKFTNPAVFPTAY